ncbi:hypothetical protein D0525_03185 [Salmonella enterica]|nr:hypothetical protein D0525_03185 [Salmonella enterica]
MLIAAGVVGERNVCTYTVLSLTHRRGFQADWLFFNKMCYFIFCNTSGEKQIFPLRRARRTLH